MLIKILHLFTVDPKHFTSVVQTVNVIGKILGMSKLIVQWNWRSKKSVLEDEAAQKILQPTEEWNQQVRDREANKTKIFYGAKNFGK